MIVEYHRPKSIEDALELLKRSSIKTVPMGGGTNLNQPSRDPIAVVDLQELGLNKIEKRGKLLIVGATVTLDDLSGQPDVQPSLGDIINHEVTHNLRQVATIGGTIVSADGVSPFTTVMMALNVTCSIQPGEEQIKIADLLPIRKEILDHRLITSVSLPLNVRMAYEYISRTPADRPIISVAVCQWSSRRTRVVIGGFGKEPVLAFDGPDAGGAGMAAKNACSGSQDLLASEEYRYEMAEILTNRCLQRLEIE